MVALDGCLQRWGANLAQYGDSTWQCTIGMVLVSAINSIRAPELTISAVGLEY